MDGVEAAADDRDGDVWGPGGAGGPADDLAVAVLGRLHRIDRLRSLGASSGTLLNELRALVPEAEAWASSEGDRRARDAAAKLRQEAEGMR
jgi:hypothetical protein